LAVTRGGNPGVVEVDARQLHGGLGVFHGRFERSPVDHHGLPVLAGDFQRGLGLG